MSRARLTTTALPREKHTGRSLKGPGTAARSAASANDVIAALKAAFIDKGGPQDESALAAPFSAGASWGYLGLVFDRD